MAKIHQDHLIDSVADALQFISYYHPKDFVDAVHAAYEREESKPAKDAMAQILINSRLCAEGHRPICQDTGIVTVFVKIGMNVQWDGVTMSPTDMINEGVRRAYLHPDNKLRASILQDPAGARKNTKDNTPAVIHMEVVEGDKIEVDVAAKGGGSENKSKMVMLNPSDSIVDWVVKTVPTMGAGWCPPGMLGIGIGGTAEKSAVLAKQVLMDAVDIQELKDRGPSNRIEELRLEIFTTVLDVKIADHPTHAASLPVTMIPNCAATRHAHFALDGSGASLQTPPSLDDWPDITWDVGPSARSINLDELTAEETQTFKPGETLLLSGTLLTGRDAAHKRIKEILERGEDLPVDLSGKLIYYVGPVDAVRDEAVGPAGPTTATRMDKFTDMMLEKTGILGMVGKAERGPSGIDAIKKHKSVYLMAVGGAAYLVSRAITSAKIVAFEDMGMEAIHEFVVKDMPVTVAVDCQGEAVHKTGPEIWRGKIASGEVKPVYFS